MSVTQSYAEVVADDAVNLTDPRFYAGRPFATYARLREQDPVHWYEPGNFWVLTRYEDVKHVSTRPGVYSARYGNMITGALADDGTPTAYPPAMRQAELRRRDQMNLLGEGNELLLLSDPPQHTKLRRLVGYAFTPRFVARMEERIRVMTAEALAEIPVGTVADLVETVSVPIPLFTIAELLGVPASEWQTFRRWTDALIEAADFRGDPASENMIFMATQLGELGAYFAQELAERRKSPRDDVLTALTQAESDGDRLTEADQMMMILLLLSAGNETSRNLISGGVQLLLDNPDQRQLLLDGRASVDNAVEEILRCESPVHAFCRTALEDTQLAGRSIGHGDYVVMIYAAANRDPAVFADPEHFLADRRFDTASAAFGFGPHHCLGAPLGRLTARVVFDELLRRFPRMEFAGPVVRRPHMALPGLLEMPVVFQ